MLTDTVYLGSTPAAEPCAQAGVTAGWLALQQLEAQVYRAALIARYGPVPPVAALIVVTQQHDFGSYASLQLRFDRCDGEAADYARYIDYGLSNWIDVNFSAPVIYDYSRQPRPGTRRSTVECIAGGIITCRRLVADGYGTRREHDVIKHLEWSYPASARLADGQLTTLGG